MCIKNERAALAKHLQGPRSTVLMPIHDDEALEIYGDTEFVVLAGHFSSLSSMAYFDLSEAKAQWRRVRFETRNAPFFSIKSISKWEHLSKHFGDSRLTGYPDVLILARVVNIYVAGTSCCECGYV